MGADRRFVKGCGLLLVRRELCSQPLTHRPLRRIFRKNHMEHFKLEIFDMEGTGSKFAAFDKDSSITILEVSEIFGSGDVWSHSFTLNVRANAHIIGTAGAVHGSYVHDQLDGRKARLWVEGIALFLGYVRLDDTVEVDEDGNIDISFEGGRKTFDSMISGAKANQVPMMSDVQIGMALWRKRWVRHRIGVHIVATAEYTTPAGHTAQYNMEGQAKSGSADSVLVELDGENENTPLQEYPRMVYPKGTFTDVSGHTASVNFLNTDHPYDSTHPYCNIDLCYQRYGYEKKNADGSIIQDYSQEPEAQRGYEVMPASRVNSAPCFFVIYWIRALMQHLGIFIEENQMEEVEDLKRLFFVNTKCAYVEPSYIRRAYNSRFGRYQHAGEGRLLAERYAPQEIMSLQECSVECTGYEAQQLGPWVQRIARVTASVGRIDDWTAQDKEDYAAHNSYFHKAFASSECFPDTDIADVISAIENGFGIRFLFSDNYQRVRIVLLRNIFRNQEVQDLTCDVVSTIKKENNIRGFRLTYGETEDTHFYYKGFADKLPHAKTLWPDTSDTHDYSHWDLDAVYQEIIHKATAFNKTCYVTKNNGNAYGIKIDKNAKRYDELHPSTFEFAGFMDAEDGDCTGEEDTIKTIDMGFTPIIMNDVNYEHERDAETEDDLKQRFALFVEETMRPRRVDLNDGQDYNDPEAVYDVNNILYAVRNQQGVFKDYVYGNIMSEDGVVKPGEFAIRSDAVVELGGLTADLKTGMPYVYAKLSNISIKGYINEGYRLYLQDNFEPNDDGVSPVESHDWGLTLGIMRGSGSAAHVGYDHDPDDGEGNDTWGIVPGDSATAHPDTCDSYGNEWDYNGDGEGIGQTEGRLSLKLRAEKPNPYFDPSQPEGPDNLRYLEITNPRLRNRGIADTLYKEDSKWEREGRIVEREVRLTIAQLLAVDKTRKVRVDDVIGFVRKMEYSIKLTSGLSMVKMEIMYI